METKVCSKCKRELPLDKAHFYPDKYSFSGWHYKCKECEGHNFSYKFADVIPDGYKKCSLCNRILPKDVEHFWKRTGRTNGFNSRCKECAGSTFGIHVLNAVTESKEEYKYCPKCHKELPATTEYFKGDKKYKNGLYRWCKECASKGLALPAREGCKICARCKRELPATSQYYHKWAKTKSGLAPACKECRGGVFEKPTSKACKRCLVEYPLTDEYFYNYKKSGLSAYCKKCNSAIAKETKDRIRKKYPEKYSEMQKRNNQNIKRKRDELRKNNPDKYEECKTKQTIQHRKRYAENPQIMKIINAKRRSRRANVQSNYSIKEWEICKKDFNYKCAYCGDSNSELCQEHFIPVTKSGEYTKNNIIPACRCCNSSKSNKDFFEWYPKQLFYSKEREQKILKYLNYDSKTKCQQIQIVV